MNTLVLKFGGSSFRDPSDYRKVAAHLAERQKMSDDKIVVVVSAMAGATDKLKDSVLNINKEASPSNLDAALATGEMLSSCFLEAALSRLGISAMSLNGYSLGIRTDSGFGRASVKRTDPRTILSELQSNDVVVAAGAQGVDECGKISFLGRNSSDLTAVIIAAMLNADTCEIYSDVPGVYTADPHLIPGAQLIPELSYLTVTKMSRHGAKVLHHKAVDYAERHRIRVVCKSLTSNGAIEGTIVTHRGCGRSVTVARDAAVLAFSSSMERDSFRRLLDRHDVSTISLEDPGKSKICLIDDLEFAMQLCARGGEHLPQSIASQTVVAELNSSEFRVHLESDYDRAISLARQIHDRMFPGAATEPLGLSKKSSAQSTTHG
ncbi:uridylate kinase [Mesorhizobium abyssinicae]|uniref:aspartate kinase n=1 Tax=Mesorhizobium abyssinicae TaxID=1209958 RepID=A0ABU5ATR5_9HYPH|nr:uridylate kinase [Mesorhizobium abyssinicae]MDX8540706.1 uridylate kinase [Mesorhizobium abyssinicae]